MRKFRLLLGAVTWTLPMFVIPPSAGHARLCPAYIDPRLAARADLGPSLPQSIAAQLHHQPTPASVAAAENRLAAATVRWTGRPSRQMWRTGIRRP